MASSHGHEKRDGIGAAACAAALYALTSACAGSTPSESTIYHDPALRPGAIAATSSEERELLDRLAASPEPQTIDVNGSTFVLEPEYTAASGRRCRGVRSGERTRLACDADGGWVFVPDVFDGAGARNVQ